MPTWPASLPQSMEVGLQRENLEGVIRTQPDTGPSKSRRRFTAVPKRYPGSLVLTGDQFDTLETFVNTEIAGGALPFDWIDPISEVPASVLIIEYQPTVVTGGLGAGCRMIRLSITIEVQP